MNLLALLAAVALANPNPLVIEVAAPSWAESGMVYVAIQNRSQREICVSEIVQDPHKLSIHRHGRRIPLEGIPFISLRGPSCQPLPSGETIHLSFNLSEVLQARSPGDRICYGARFLAGDGQLNEPKGCTLGR